MAAYMETRSIRDALEEVIALLDTPSKKGQLLAVPEVLTKLLLLQIKVAQMEDCGDDFSNLVFADGTEDSTNSDYFGFSRWVA